MESKKVSKCGYLIPEFPGQTHIWIWREIVHLREWGLSIRLYSTRRPSERDRARHGFAEAAAEETFYLWPQSFACLLMTALWAIFTRPLALWGCFRMAWSLPVDKQPGRRRPAFALIPAACVMAHDMERSGISHLHCHTCASGAVIAILIKRLTGIPYSMTLNANLEWWGGAMEEKLSEAKFTIAITAWLLEQIRRDYAALPRDQALLGRIGVDTKKWAPRPRVASEAETFRIVSVGRLHASKGHDILLRAIMKVREALSDNPAMKQAISLTVIGDGPERKALESLARHLKIDDIAKFAGSLGEEKVIVELLGSDLFVLASHSEPLGVVYMEAMALALPTVGTAAGGVPEIITDGVNGWLVPPHDIDALAGRIRWLMENRTTRLEVARAGRDSIVAKFDSRLGAATLYEKLTGVSPHLIIDSKGVAACAS